MFFGVMLLAFRKAFQWYGLILYPSVMLFIGTILILLFGSFLAVAAENSRDPLYFFTIVPVFIYSVMCLWFISVVATGYVVFRRSIDRLASIGAGFEITMTRTSTLMGAVLFQTVLLFLIAVLIVALLSLSRGLGANWLPVVALFAFVPPTCIWLLSGAVIANEERSALGAYRRALGLAWKTKGLFVGGVLMILIELAVIFLISDLFDSRQFERSAVEDLRTHPVLWTTVWLIVSTVLNVYYGIWYHIAVERE